MAENIILRKQLIVVSRHRKIAPNLSIWDRLCFGFFAAIINPKRIAKVTIFIKPSMIIKYHKAMITNKCRILFSNKSKRKPGPPGPSQELVNAIIVMKKSIPRFGCRRIAMQMNSIFGININKDVVWRILSKHYKPTSYDDGPSWLSFIGHINDSLRQGILIPTRTWESMSSTAR